MEIDGHGVTKRDITACHRIGRKGKTICRFVNRKFANSLLYNTKNLKEFEQLKSIYVNNSFCREFGLINFLIRRSFNCKKLYRYKVKNGINLIKLSEEENDFREITHINDLSRFGIDIELEEQRQ